MEKAKERLISAISSFARHDFTRVENISYIYVERAQKETATEERLLAELSKETFCPVSSFKTIPSGDPLHISVGDIRDNTDALYLAVSLDDTVFFSKTWVEPL